GGRLSGTATWQGRVGVRAQGKSAARLGGRVADRLRPTRSELWVHPTSNSPLSATHQAKLGKPRFIAVVFFQVALSLGIAEDATTRCRLRASPVHPLVELPDRRLNNLSDFPSLSV